MSEEYRFKDRIKDIINGDVDYDKLRKAEKQGWICLLYTSDAADE